MLIEEQRRVLLFKFAFSSGPLAETVFWATPGGEVHDGETFEQAAKREVFEEAGIDIGGIRFGAPITEREFPLVLPNGESVHAIEKIFVVYAEDIEPISIINTYQTDEERDFLVQHRWWSADDIEAASDKIYPEDLAALLRDLPQR
jgi:8-oxo-dGTP pyrophosphatase MutT (NUDIX family)